MSTRKYETENPWITFQYQAEINTLWMQLGEAYSKCQHLAGTPLKPAIAEELGAFYLTRGALASAAIEGNTLSEEEAKEILVKNEKLPRSQEYLETELRNIADAITAIDHSMRNEEPFRVTVEWLKEQNRRILSGLELDDDITPGEFSTRRMVVGNYRGAPAEDFEYLMGRMCDWLNEWLDPVNKPDVPEEQRFVGAFFAATLGHLYIAWIHPFGDGNGRTARLLSCAILARSGVVPHVSSNVLSDFYNRTRSRYYQKLSDASTKGDVEGFIRYSAEGFVDMLREQISTAQEYQKQVAWKNHIHEQLEGQPSGKTKDRRRALALAFPTGRVVERKEIRHLTPELAEQYAGHDDKMISRDLSALKSCRVVYPIGRMKYVALDYVMEAFKPIVSSNVPDKNFS